MSIVYQYHIPDIVCGNCSSLVEKTIRETPFFKEHQMGVDPIEKTLTITFEEDAPSYLEIRDVLNEVLDPVGFSCVETEIRSIHPKKSRFSHRILGVIGVSIGLLFLIASMFVLPPWMMFFMTGVSLPLTLFLGVESYEKAWKKFKKGLVTMDSLFALSTLSILTVSIASFVLPTLPMMCEAGLLIFGFRHIGLAIEEAFKQTNMMVRRFQDEAPSHVTRVEGDKLVRVPLALIQKKDILSIKSGEVLPVDGIFEEEGGLILDKIVTGSNMPRRIILNEQLYAGTRLSDAEKPLRYRATAVAHNSHLARLDAKIAYAKLEKATLETITTQILQYFIPLVLGIAAVSGFLIGGLFSTGLGIQSAVAVLVSACPCTLGLITPLAMRVGIKKAADSGVIFNSAKKLELTDSAECVVFDLNGTLTEGKPIVVKYDALARSPWSSRVLLQLIGHFEKKCQHPVAKAICSSANQYAMLSPFSDYEVLLNHYAGRVLYYENARYTIGSEALLVEQGVALTDIDALRQKLDLRGGENLVCLAKEKTIIGYVVLQDKLRKDAKVVIESLKRAGKRPYLCTGADAKTADEYARQLGIAKQDVRAYCVSHAKTDSLHSKKRVIDDLHRKGFVVAAVGDGANDAEMIAAADVGFAIASEGDAHTQQHASAIIKGVSLQPILHAFNISRQTVKNIKENLCFSLIYNISTVFLAAGLLLSVGIVVNPAVGAALMILQTSFIFMNVYRFANAAIPKIELNPPFLDHSVCVEEKVLSTFISKPNPTSYQRTSMFHSSLNQDANVPCVRNGVGFTHS